MEVLKNENVNKKQPVNENTQREKLSYEELENIAHQLSDQSKKLAKDLQTANMSNVLKRLDYLFKIVELEKQFDEDFVNDCKAEIKGMIVIPEGVSEEEQLTEENK